MAHLYFHISIFNLIYMSIFINDEQQPVNSTNVLELLQEIGVDQQGIALFNLYSITQHP